MCSRRRHAQCVMSALLQSSCGHALDDDEPVIRQAWALARAAQARPASSATLLVSSPCSPSRQSAQPLLAPVVRTPVRPVFPSRCGQLAAALAQRWTDRERSASMARTRGLHAMRQAPGRVVTGSAGWASRTVRRWLACSPLLASYAAVPGGPRLGWCHFSKGHSPLQSTSHIVVMHCSALGSPVFPLPCSTGGFLFCPEARSPLTPHVSRPSSWKKDRRRQHLSRTIRSCVGAFSWVSGLVAGRLLLPLRGLGEGDHFHRSLAVKPFHVALRNEFRERELPGLLPMVGEPAEFLWVQT